MSWIAISPMPPDFCGCPPCPRCFQWQEGNGPPTSGLSKMALDLLAKPLDDLKASERRKLDGVVRKMHGGGIAALCRTPKKTPPPAPAVDIGMSSSRVLEGWLREKRRKEPPKPRVLTLDEIFARKAEQEAAEKVKRKEKEERLKEAREVAAVFAEAQRGQDERQRYEEQRLLRDVDPRFVEYCRERGISSVQEIYSRYQREYMRGPSYMVDPLKGNSRYGY